MAASSYSPSVSSTPESLAPPLLPLDTPPLLLSTTESLAPPLDTPPLLDDVLFSIFIFLVLCFFLWFLSMEAPTWREKHVIHIHRPDITIFNCVCIYVCTCMCSMMYHTLGISSCYCLMWTSSTFTGRIRT